MRVATLEELEVYSNLAFFDITELYGYINEIELGYIKANYHPEDDNIVILNYTELATFEKRWNKYTMSARGLILDLTNVTNNGIVYILAKPFDKFPNYGSNEIIGYEDDIDWGDIESVMEKMDGSLGISYYFRGEIRFATKGSFSSDQAIRANEIWQEKYAYTFDLVERGYYTHYPYTILVEIIYPDNRIVVDYSGLEDLVLLGIRDTHEGIEDILVDWNFATLDNFAQSLKMPIAKQYTYSLNDLIELKGKLTANEEGFIVKFKNGKRLKIKGEQYLQVHRIKHGMSTKAKYKAWTEGRLDEYIMMLPEEFRPELEQFRDNLDKFKNAQYFMLQLLFEQAIDKHKDKKEFALHVTSIIAPEYRKHMFKAFKKGAIDEQLIKDDILKDYDKYEEVISKWNK